MQKPAADRKSSAGSVILAAAVRRNTAMRRQSTLNPDSMRKHKREMDEEDQKNDPDRPGRRESRCQSAKQAPAKELHRRSMLPSSASISQAIKVRARFMGLAMSTRLLVYGDSPRRGFL